SQKQFLSGFAMGNDVARAVKGLPVLAGSAGNQTVLQIGGDAATVDGQTLAVGPERIALRAQYDTESAGGKLCKEEQAKRDKNPLDMWDEIIARSDAGEFPKGTDVFLTKFHGLFHVAPAQDAYMMRLRIPGGLIRGWQLSGLADLAEKHAGAFIDITTRANLQLREIPADGARGVLYGVRHLDLISLGSGGDNIRNCTASCLSGIDASELIQTIPLAQSMHHYILNHREMYGLPRKFNIAFEGGGAIASLDDTNDIGFRAVLIDESNADAQLPAGVYFQLTLGGITGHKDFARPTGIILRPDECVTVAGAIVRVFVKHGNRTNRKSARLKYVLDDWGFDRFIAAVEEELETTFQRVDEKRLTITDNENRLAHVGFHVQSQTGFQYVGVVLPVGRMSADQARVLADVANRYGNSEIRLTVWQNLIIPHIRDEDVEKVRDAIVACGLDTDATSFRAGLVACTGSAGCKFAGADTKRHAIEIASHLEQHLTLDTPINIHLTGCHHSCAQHYIGDIGLIACQVEQGDDMVDGYHMMVGGGWGARQGIGRPIAESIPADVVPRHVAGLVSGYLRDRLDGESFVDFARRTDDTSLQSMLSLSTESPAIAAV
ncbi:MAG: NirA family protein, partial [Planctomycetota bacterium]